VILTLTQEFLVKDYVLKLLIDFQDVQFRVEMRKDLTRLRNSS
jgi:hypothetical protein